MTPKLHMTSAVRSSVTYSFRAAIPFGWALCTVNDATGELLITSDWGNWSYRWHVGGFGDGIALTAFISTCDVDYLARKLQGGICSAFSSEGTARALRRELCGRRLDDGRRQRKHGIDRADPGFSQPRGIRRLLTLREARELWERLDDTARGTADDPSAFYAELLDCPEFTSFVTETPWEYAVHEPIAGDRALRDSVLPALIEACHTVSARAETIAH